MRLHVFLLGQTRLLTACMRVCMASVHACERDACMLTQCHQHGKTFALTQCLHLVSSLGSINSLNMVQHRDEPLRFVYMPLRLVSTMYQFSANVAVVFRRCRK